MTYATRTDIEDLYGADFLNSILDEDVDADIAVTAAMGRASAEIDTHLSARYAVPISGKPLALVTLAVNIGVYNLVISHAHLTDSIRDRYKDAVDLLKRIADGKAGLGADEPHVSDDPDVSAGGASFSAKERLFSRDTL